MYFLIADGGVKPLGCYGSFVILRGRSLHPPAGYPLPEEIAHETFTLPDYKTNNQAEYGALLAGLRVAVTFRAPMKVLMDSQLVIKQVTGQWRCKDRELGKLKREAQHLLGQLEQVTLAWVDKSLVEEYLGH